jgi:transposase InsO family protein
MPWRRMEVEDQQLQFVARAVSGKEPLAALCRDFGISRPTGYLWRARYREAGRFTALHELSRRPHHSPTRTEEWQQAGVVALRKQTGWGAKKLQILLSAEAGMAMPVRTIHRILKRRGLVGKEIHTPAPQRLKRAAPNELWQMDTKGKYPLPQAECHPLSVVDDHSRYLVGLYALPVLSTPLAWSCLVDSFERHGVPQAMLMDRGSLWWSEHNGWGLTRLSVRLIEQGIRLRYGRVCHPQTQGKVERFHRTLGAELRHRGLPVRWAEWAPLLAAIQRDYNERRPHEALGMRRPAEVYQPSRGSYQACPPEWEYPSGSEVKRLNGQGLLHEAGQRWFVCEALAGRRVRLERLDGKVLMSYRPMYLREIDPQRRRTRPLVVERREGGGVAGPCPDTLRAEALAVDEDCGGAIVPVGSTAVDEAPSMMALRLFWPPLQARMELDGDHPNRLFSSQVRGKILFAAGPWRNSGGWWEEENWDREEWDVEIRTGKTTALYSLYHDLARDEWYLQGEYD